MFRHPAQRKDYDPDEYLRDADNRFLFDPDSGIYKPKTAYKEKKSEKFKFLTLSPFQWGTLLLSAATLIFLVKYTNYARLQWREAKRTADQTVISANAARKSADTVEHSFEMEKRRAEDMEEAVCRVQSGGMAALDNTYPVQIINNGKVSARNVEAHIEISLNAIPSNQKIRTLATLTISANEIPKEKDEARRLNLPLSSHDWDNIANTKEIIVQSGTLKYENGFDRTDSETICDFWLYFRTPEDKLNPIQGRGATCGRLPELLKSYPPKRN